MKLLCPSCNVILRVKATSTVNRQNANCPRCSADVSLTDNRFDTASAADDRRVKVRCKSCGTTLRALESFLGTRSNCPKCHDEVLIERASSVAVGVDVRVSAVGIDTMAMQKPPLPETNVDLDEFLDTPTADSQSTETSAVGGATGGLLNAPIDALTEAAEGIRESAENFGHQIPVESGDDDGFQMDDVSEDSFEHETHADHAHQEEQQGIDEHAVEEQEPVEEPHFSPDGHADEFETSHTARTFSTGSGFLSGALAGMVVGGVWVLVAMFAGSAVSTFMSPLPAWTGGWGIPTNALIIAFPAFFGAFAGLLATFGSSTRRETGPNFVRCVAWGLLGGLFMASMTITQPGDVFNQVAFSSALNWIRDFMLVGMLIPAVARLFGATSA